MMTGVTGCVIPLVKITGLVLQRHYTDLQTEGLSAKSIKNIHSILHKMFALAVRWGVCGTNPAAMVELPKHVKPETTCTDPAGIQAIIEASESAGNWRVPTLIAAFTGMRRGEVLGLQWQDFDEVKARLSVRRALSPVAGEGVIVKGTKTDRVRIVDIPQSLVAILNEHRTQTQFNSPNDWICTRPDGRHLPQKFTENFASIAKRAGIDITLHGLRHSQVTLLLDAGVSLQDVSARVGHNNTSTTLNIYAHALPAKQRQAAEIVGELLRKKPENDRASVTHRGDQGPHV